MNIDELYYFFNIQKTAKKETESIKPKTFQNIKPNDLILQNFI